MGLFASLAVRLSSNAFKGPLSLVLLSNFARSLCANFRISFSTILVIICVASGHTHRMSLQYTNAVLGTSERKGMETSVRRPVDPSHNVGKYLGSTTCSGILVGKPSEYSHDFPRKSFIRKGLSPLYVRCTPSLDKLRVILYNHPESWSPTTEGPKFCSIAKRLSFPLYAENINKNLKIVIQ